MAEETKPATFLETLRGRVLTSIPALSVLAFVIVAVKVFRASGMETSTTVAIVSTADVVALLKGVILTLLPGFLAGIIAASMWVWAGSVPEEGDQEGARQALLSGEAALAWTLLATGFFTISWPAFLVLFVPCTLCTAWLLGRALGRWGQARSGRRLRSSMRVFGATSAIASVAFLTLSATVWTPLRLIQVLPGHTIELKGRPLPDRFGAFVLNSGEDGASLLLDTPRAVIQVRPDVIAPDPPICIPEPSPSRRFFLRASQILGLEADRGSPYSICPKLPD